MTGEEHTNCVQHGLEAVPPGFIDPSQEKNEGETQNTQHYLNRRNME